MTKELKTRVLLNLLAAALLLALCGEYGGTRLGIIETLEKQSYDWRLTRDTAIKNHDIVIVDIDRDTLREYGNWPIPRGLFADLNKQLLSKYQAKVVAYTVPFSQSNDTALRVLDDINAELGGNNAVIGSNNPAEVVERLRQKYDYDSLVIDSLGSRVLLGFVFDETGRVEGNLPPPLKFNDPSDKEMSSLNLNVLTRDWNFYTGVAGNLRPYLNAVDNAAGHLNVNIDRDGIVRHAPHFVNYANAWYSSLPIAIYQKLSKDTPIVAHVDQDGFIGRKIIKQATIGNRTIPLNKDGRMYINYLGDGGRNVNFETTQQASFRYVSFADVIDGKVPQKQLEDKIILVGSSSEQLPYLYATPLNASMPEVEILATQLANLLDNNILHRNRDILHSELAMVLAIAVLLSILLAATSPIISFALLLVAIAGYIFFALNRWESANEVWTILPAVITLSGMYLVNLLSGFVAQWQANRSLQDTFGQYVPPEFAKELANSDQKINMEGEERELSILFSDVRGFTAISETLTPRELTLLMNRMLNALTDQIQQQSGTVDKYIGDAVMAFWNAPVYIDDHALKSVKTALGMQEAMAALSADMRKNGFDKPLNLGVGICTGNANVGNMGSDFRMAYTALGDTVNLASRTESLTKFYGVPILITESTHAQCHDDIACRTVDLVRVKGRDEPVLLYQPVGIKNHLRPEDLRVLEQFDDMRKKYVAGDFSAALDTLVDYTQQAPDDALAGIYAKRLEALMQNPPTEWDGVMTHTSK